LSATTAPAQDRPLAAARRSLPRRRRHRVGRTPATLSWPLIAGLVVIGLFPFVYTIGLALTHSTLGRPLDGFTGLDNFRDAWEATAFRGSLVRSVVFAFSASAIQLVAGTAIALLLVLRGKRLGWLGVALLLPLVTPPVMVGVAWKLLLAPVGGALPHAAASLGLGHPNPLGDPTGAFAALLAIDTWQWTPFVTLLVYAALLGVPRELLDAARIDGANTWQAIRYIALPMIAGTLAAVFILRLVIAFKVFDIVYVVTSGGPGFSTTLSSFDIYRTGLIDFQVGEAAAATLIFAVMVGLIVALVSRVQRRVTGWTS
jgi:multiple sugar transport system permease protein